MHFFRENDMMRSSETILLIRFIAKILATYADDSVLNEEGKIDYRLFKPVLFEFLTYEYYVTGEPVGKCMKMNG